MTRLIIVGMLLLATVVPSGAAAIAPLQPRSLDGSGNNQRHSAELRGRISKEVAGPPTRYVSNRIFNDVGQNLFSENDVSQWGWAWGQFIDHDIGLRDERPAESDPIPFDPSDPLERFTNGLGAIDFSRTPAAPGTGVSSPRQQVNTLSSYIGSSNVYGVTSSCEEWLRDGPFDGRLSNNKATLMLTPGGYLPRVDARGDPASAHAHGPDGRARGDSRQGGGSR